MAANFKLFQTYFKIVKIEILFCKTNVGGVQIQEKNRKRNDIGWGPQRSKCFTDKISVHCLIVM